MHRAQWLSTHALLSDSTPSIFLEPARAPSTPPLPVPRLLPPPGQHPNTHLAALDHPQGAEAHGLASVLQGCLGGRVRGAGPPLQGFPREPRKAADAHFWGEAEKRGHQEWPQLREPTGKATRLRMHRS